MGLVQQVTELTPTDAIAFKTAIFQGDQCVEVRGMGRANMHR